MCRTAGRILLGVKIFLARGCYNRMRQLRGSALGANDLEELYETMNTSVEMC